MDGLTYSEINMVNNNQTTQYDPQAVAMVRAIRLQESSNNYNAPKEKAGTSLGGGYQYQEPTWRQYAKEILGDENAEFTPENQDKVTYGKVKQWKDQGLQPKDIAHKWNPGDPSYPDLVVNHLKQIAANGGNPPSGTQKSVQYQTQTTPAKVTEQVKPETTKAGEVIRDIVRPFAKVGASVKNIKEGIQGKEMTDIDSKYLGKVERVGKGFDATKGLTPENVKALKDSVGTGLEIGSTVAGGGGVGQAGKLGLRGFLKEAAKTGAKTGFIGGGAAGLGQGLSQDKSLAKSLVQGGVGAIGGGITGGILGAGTGLLSRGVGKLTGVADQKAQQLGLASLQEKISPKLTAKELKLATKQGRFIPGKEPGLFTAGTSESVVPTDTIVRASQTIQKEIPRADKMNSTELYNALSENIATRAKGLEKKMKKVKLDESLVKTLNDKWDEIKLSQRDSALADQEKNLLKLQTKFESFLQKSKSGTLNDLWDTAKNYDKSIPESVKKATSLSSDSAQMQKEIWLQNRAILKDAINDAGLGLGKSSKGAFQKMSDLYNAQEGIISNVKAKTNPKSSKVTQFFRDNPVGSAVGTGAGLLGISQAGGIIKILQGME